MKGFPKAAVGKDNANKQLEVNLKTFMLKLRAASSYQNYIPRWGPGLGYPQGPVSIWTFPLPGLFRVVVQVRSNRASQWLEVSASSGLLCPA